MNRPSFEQFFAFRRFESTLAFSADGRSVLFSSNISGQFNLWEVPVEGGWPQQLTPFTDTTVRGATVRSQDGTIVFAADTDGDEFFQLWAIRPESGWPERWTEAPQVQHLLGARPWSPDGSRLAYAANARTPTDMEIWIRDGDEARPLFGEGIYAVPGEWSPDGRHLVALEARSNTDSSLHLLDVAAGTARELTPHEHDVKYGPGPWAPDGSGFYVLSDEGREFVGLGFYHLDAGLIRWIETPEHDVDELAGSDDGRLLAWVENVDGWARVRVRDLERGADLPDARLPRGCTLIFGSALTFSPDGSRYALIWEQPRRPQEIWVAETVTGATSQLTDSRVGRLRDEDLSDPELVSFPSFDGREIPAWLYRPEGKAKAPVVLSIHGGPEAQERPNYRPLYQYLASRGIAVLAPNIRGSTGYGKTYQKLIHRDWGGGDLEDFRHAAGWLREQDWADPSRIGVYGGSYGGFAVLTCATRLPGYWAAAVDIFGPSNLVTFARAVPPTWRRFMAEMVGDPETEEAFLRERSPLTYIEDLRAPILVIQGANDPRVVQSESDQLVERLGELGREVEYEVFADEGHGFTRKSNELRAFRLAADWLERHLTGTATLDRPRGECENTGPWPQAPQPSSRS
ncbi:MAG: prolyl oligopeptidase family serine peptidase [Gaiellaceae bacterium]